MLCERADSDDALCEELLHRAESADDVGTIDRSSERFYRVAYLEECRIIAGIQKRIKIGCGAFVAVPAYKPRDISGVGIHVEQYAELFEYPVVAGRAVCKRLEHKLYSPYVVRALSACCFYR